MFVEPSRYSPRLCVLFYQIFGELIRSGFQHLSTLVLNCGSVMFRNNLCLSGNTYETLVYSNQYCICHINFDSTSPIDFKLVFIYFFAHNQVAVLSLANWLDDIETHGDSLNDISSCQQNTALGLPMKLC